MVKENTRELFYLKEDIGQFHFKKWELREAERGDHFTPLTWTTHSPPGIKLQW